MDTEFWMERWREGRIGFHEGRPNTFLERHVGELGAQRRVLVPLCGKSEDMAFLASRGHEVVGIELVPEAIEAFFREHGLTPAQSDGPRVRAWSAGGITILEGDVFACTREDVGAVTALYDRAAIVALPPDVRPRYVAHLRSLLAPGARGLLVTFEYPQERVSPPPFSVGADEVRALYAGARVTELESRPLEGPRFTDAGVTGSERCLSIAL